MKQRMIKTVFIMKNGMVAVFDENDKQIPDLQGPIFEVMEAIGKTFDLNTEFKCASSLEVGWFYEKYRSPAVKENSD